MMTPPLVDYLCKYGDTRITVASNIIEDAQKIAARHPNHMDACYLDVFDVSVSIYLAFSVHVQMHCDGLYSDNLLSCESLVLTCVFCGISFRLPPLRLLYAR